MVAKKNTWFKHYNTASQGHTLSVLWANKDTEGIALFWLILELVSRFESEEKRGEITISWSVLQRETNWKQSKCRRVLARIAPVSKIETSDISDGYVSFLVPNWLELQQNRKNKTEKSEKNVAAEDRGEKEEVRGEKEDDIDSDANAPNLFNLWNQFRGNLSEAKVFSAKRKQLARSRLKECSNEQVWIAAIQALATSPFCNGQNDRGWLADFDFLLKPDTRIKALEGKYTQAPVKQKTIRYSP